MLRKLLKYEFRASLLILPICLVAMALLYGAGWAAKAIGISQLGHHLCRVPGPGGLRLRRGGSDHRHSPLL